MGAFGEAEGVFDRAGRRTWRTVLSLATAQSPRGPNCGQEIAKRHGRDGLAHTVDLVAPSLFMVTMSPGRRVGASASWRAAVGGRRDARVSDAVPHGPWKTATQLAALRTDRLSAP